MNGKKIKIVEWANGNIGALSFLMEISSRAEIEPDVMYYILEKLEKYKTVRGTNLYVLYNDLCDRDIYKVYYLLRECPQTILEDACSRQDYSGQELVQGYLPKNNQQNDNTGI